MKKIVVILFVILPVIGFSQIKPSLPKAEKALKDGKIDEAKSIIDATIASQEFMVDKKGQPSKQAAKAYFLKAVIYAAIDTTSQEKFKSLEPNPFPIVKESFDKAKELDPKSPYFVTDASNILPMMNDAVYGSLAQKYYNMAVTQFQDKKDYKKAFLLIEETLYFLPTDTTVLQNAGVYFGPQAEEWEKSLTYIDKYQAGGGKNPDAYIQKFTILTDKLKDNDRALVAIKDAITKNPSNAEFPKYELDIYIKTNKLPEAKAAMERKIKSDPSVKESYYYLGLINSDLKDYPGARKAYEEAFKLDNKYFDAALGIAELAYLDAKKVKTEMNQLGITAADKKKRFDLDKIYVEELRKVVPYWETAEKLSPDDSKVLDTLLGIYQDLGDTAKTTKTAAHMKKLGLLD